MKKVLILVCTFALGSLLAQDKETEKEWKKKLKELSPLEYKALVEERDELEATVSGLEDNIADLETKNAQLQSEIDDYKAELEKAAATQATPDASSNDPNAVTGQSGNTYKTSTAVDGVVFKVQVGAFKNFDLKKYFDNHENFSGEVDEDGTMKYTLGVFKEYWEADKFKKYLRDMGVKGAWVVAYKDGKRVDMKDVLEGVL